MNGGDVLGDGDKEEGRDVDEERDNNTTSTAEGGIISNSTSKGGAEGMDIATSSTARSSRKKAVYSELDDDGNDISSSPNKKRSRGTTNRTTKKVVCAEDDSEAEEDVPKKKHLKSEDKDESKKMGTDPDGRKELELPQSMEESDDEEDVIDIGLLPRPTGTYSGIEDRVQEHLTYQTLKEKGHSMERNDEVGWALMYKIMTGREFSHATSKSNSKSNKYYQYQYGSSKSHLGYDIHPFDQKNTRAANKGSQQTVSLSINEVTDMCKEAREKVSERYGITHWTTPGYNSLGRLTALGERWSELTLVLAKVQMNPNDKKNNFMIRHLGAETGWIPKFSKQQWAALDAAPARQDEAYRIEQVFEHILLELGGEDYVPPISFPSEEEIPEIYDTWLGKEENLVHKRAKEATRSLSSEQHKLVAAVSNNFKPNLDSVEMIDTYWLDVADHKQRDFRKLLFDLRYKYGKNRTPIPSRLRHLVKAAQAPENRHMYLMMFDLDHHSDVAVEQKRRDQLELGRSQPSELTSQELYERARLFSLLLTSAHAIKTLGEVPAVLDPTRTQRSTHILYRLVVALEKHALGEVCTMSGKELPDHVLEGHHDAERRNIREGNTVHPTAKACNRFKLYQCRMEYVSWSTRLFKEVGKKTRLSREWHRFTHFVLNNLDWFEEHFEIDYPYEIRRNQLVRQSF